ncbi:MAG TPA: hypothetical protein VGI57_09360 [Usitatibacter sp.]|jgi:hypothetical protein
MDKHARIALLTLLVASITSATAGGPASEQDPTGHINNGGQPVQKKCVPQGALSKLPSGPSQAELAKRAEEIRQIEEARRRQQQIGEVHNIVTPMLPPVPGTVINDGVSSTTTTGGRMTTPAPNPQQEKCQ